jgi:hypothetical protein
VGNPKGYPSLSTTFLTTKVSKKFYTIREVGRRCYALILAVKSVSTREIVLKEGFTLFEGAQAAGTFFAPHSAYDIYRFNKLFGVQF